jgi:hypothetical protein
MTNLNKSESKTKKRLTNRVISFGLVRQILWLFVLSTYEIWKVRFHLHNFTAKKNRLSCGVAFRALVEICLDNISVFRATNLKIWLSFVSWAELMHLIPRILKFEISRANSGVKKFKITFEFFVEMLDGLNFGKRYLLRIGKFRKKN